MAVNWAAEHPDTVPAYSQTEIWVGTGLCLAILAGLLVWVLSTNRLGSRRPRHKQRHPPRSST